VKGGIENSEFYNMVLSKHINELSEIKNDGNCSEEDLLLLNTNKLE